MGAIYMNGICFGSSDIDMLPVVSLTYDEYVALPEETKNNGNLYLLTDVNGTGDDFQPIIYSEEEREIGVWTDGKPLYEKTYILSNDVSIGYTDWTSISDLDDIKDTIDTIVGCQSFWKTSTVTLTASIYASFNKQNDAHIKFIDPRNGASTTISIITIRYTKTTDTPGSGVWTPQGVPAIHYSEDEHIVGTWIDGSTIYEKTFEFSTEINISANTWTTIVSDVSALNIGKLVFSSAQANPMATAALNIMMENNALKTFIPFAYTVKSITIRYTKSS